MESTSEELVVRPAALPVAHTPFLGRAGEVRQVSELLRGDDVRLLTLTGPGGVGKSRLALEVARQAQADFADGAYFIALGAVTDIAQVAPAIGRALGVAEFSERPVWEYIEAYLHIREVLLVVDGFEHVLESGPLLQDLLEVGLDIKIVVASRSALHLSAEHEFPVSPLSFPLAGKAPVDADHLQDYAAMDLFVQRARAVRPDFRLRPDNAEAISQICARLDGLPLAIELAAARVRLLEPESMLAQFQRRLPFLTGGARDLPARHRTLRDAISWSYDLLDDNEKRLFRLLAGFTDGFTLESASAIIEGVDGTTTGFLPVIESLLDKSMLIRLADRESRVGMLETIHEYGGDLLASEGDEAAVRRAHAEYFLHLGETANSHSHRAEELVWLDRLDDERQNLGAALGWFLDDGQPEAAIRMANALARFWYVRGHLAEGRRWFDEALRHPEIDPGLRGRALCAASQLATHLGESDRAERLAQEALECAQRNCDDGLIGTALAAISVVRQMQGRHDEARQSSEDGAAILRRINDRGGLIDVLCSICVAAIQLGDFPRARLAGNEALSLSRELGDSEGIAYALVTLPVAMLFERPDDPTVAVEAEVLLQEGLAAARVVGNRRWSSRASATLGLAAARRGDYLTALDRYDEAVSITSEFGDWWFLASSCLLGQAAVLAALERHEDATCLLGASEGVLAANGVPMPAGVLSANEVIVAGLRLALGQQAFDDAWSRGREMTFEETVATFHGMATHEVATPAANSGGLTKRELATLKLISQGMTDAEAAEALYVSRRTIHAHLRSIYSKLGVRNRAAATRYAIEHHLA
ncbi:MAG: LuxR C-terminal-related transcriptional regulator [Acidimicrobiales bacterium]